MRQSLTRRDRNRKNMSQLRTQIKRIRAAIAKGDAQEAGGLLRETGAVIDTAAKQGVIHDNAAARYKSRIQLSLNKADAK
jgi:small subunit ribosomal protein S20